MQHKLSAYDARISRRVELETVPYSVAADEVPSDEDEDTDKARRAPASTPPGVCLLPHSARVLWR